MSELVHSARGGEFATSRRGGIAGDVDFILSQKARGLPASVVARMVARPVVDVRAVYACAEVRPVERDLPVVPEAAPTVAPEIARNAERPKRQTPDERKARHNERRRLAPGVLAQRSGSDKRSRIMPSWARSHIKPILEYYGIRFDELIGDSRKRRIAEVRLECYHALHLTGRCTTTQIGRWFGGRDHSSIVYGIGRHQERLAARELAEAA